MTMPLFAENAGQKIKTDNPMITVNKKVSFIGVIFYIYGNNLNNDIDAQMNYLFGEGKTNPGSTCVTIGIVFLVAGALLLITATVKVYNKSKQEKTTLIAKQFIICDKCGNKIDNDSVFCKHCGQEVKQQQNDDEFIFCTSCGKELPNDSEFCMYCGKSV